MRVLRPLLLLLIFGWAAPTLAYTVYLKDGSHLLAKGPYTIEGSKAIITLQNGTRTSIVASEIDSERTEKANQSSYGGALLLDDRGNFTQVPDNEPIQPRESLSEAMGGRSGSAATRPPARRQIASPDSSPKTLSNGDLDFRTLARSPFSDLDLAAEVQRIFRANSVDQVLISQGTAQGRLLIDLTTNSEASVFRGLEAAAKALEHARDLYPAVSTVFELMMTTSDRDPAGQFVLTRANIQPLLEQQIDTSTFFIEHVRY